MSQHYASQQPQGYKNHIENVAIVGAGGQVGKYIVESLLKTGKQVVAITRADSTSTVPNGVEVRKVNYDDPQTLVAALQGIEVLVITMSVTAPEDQQTKLFDAAAEAKVPWILPNEWGVDHSNESLGKDTMLGERNSKYRDYLVKLGVSSWIGICCSFWYEYSLSFGPDSYGFDLENRTVTFVDDGNTKINTSTWPQTARAVANLLNLKVLPEDEGDTSPCLSRFRNRLVYVSSFLVSQRDMLDSVLRVTGTKIDDWTISSEEHTKRYQSGVDLLRQGSRMGFARLLYSRVLYPNGGGDFEAKLDNDALGLPKEDLDEFTKVALSMKKMQF